MNFLALCQCAIVSILLVFISNVSCDINAPIPADKTALDSWFQSTVKPYSARKGTLNASLEAAESKPPKIIMVRKDGSGDFKTINAALKSIPKKNTQRVIVHIGSGVYNEKVIIDYGQHFVTLHGNPKSMPTIAYGDTAKTKGTDDSATLIVLADFFVAANIIIKNTAPRPLGKPGAQAVALRIWGDKAALYGCRLLGYQDTLCDDMGKHFYKDCYIEGTVDFIFGRGKSLFLNNELHVIQDKYLTVVTAHQRQSEDEDTGFSLVHCSVTGDGTGAFLGRTWSTMPRTIFAYTSIGSVVNPAGWFNNFHPEREKNVDYGEYRSFGPGYKPNERVKYGKILTGADVKRYISLSYIDAAKWLLPPPKL